MNSKVEAELKAWMRPVSSLTAFAKTIKNQGGAETPPPSSSSEDQQQKLVDHFEGIDLDELPDNVRDAVKNARESITKLHSSATQLEQKRIQAENFARQQQSKADRLASVVSKHNLDPDAAKPNLSDDKHKARVARIMQEIPGIKPELAEAHAKMLAAEANATREEILKELGPLAHKTNNINAQQVLANVESANEEIFSIPEVAKSVRENVAVLVQQGAEISTQSVEHLVNLAYGQHLRSGGKPMETKTTQTLQVPNFRSQGPQGNHARLPDNQNNGAPVATDPQTTSIINAINVHMRHGLPSKK